MVKIIQKAKAFKLREKGKSYREISNKLEISRSTVSCWFKNVKWSNEIKKKLERSARVKSRESLIKFLKIRKDKLTKFYNQAEKEAKSYFYKNKNNVLFISSLALYWGEGDKGFKNGRIKLSNIDPEMIVIFRKFLLENIEVEKEKIKAWILLYPDINPQKALYYWSKNTGIPKNNFSNSIVIKGRHKTKRLSYGVCNIYVTNKYLKKKIITWIDLYKKEFGKLRV